jgi:hypothetical protein
LLGIGGLGCMKGNGADQWPVSSCWKSACIRETRLLFLKVFLWIVFWCPDRISLTAWFVKMQWQLQVMLNKCSISFVW